MTNNRVKREQYKKACEAPVSLSQKLNSEEKLTRAEFKVRVADETIVHVFDGRAPCDIHVLDDWKSPKDSSIWKTIDEQQEKYGSVDTPEINWGNDVELDDID